MRTYFVWAGIKFDVRRSPSSGRWVYRDAAHLGGPWTDACAVLANTSIKASFRRALKDAIRQEVPVMVPVPA